MVNKALAYQRCIMLQLCNTGHPFLTKRKRRETCGALEMISHLFHLTIFFTNCSSFANLLGHWTMSFEDNKCGNNNVIPILDLLC